MPGVCTCAYLTSVNQAKASFARSVFCTASNGSSYGPRTRLIRGISTAVVMIENYFA